MSSQQWYRVRVFDFFVMRRKECNCYVFVEIDINGSGYLKECLFQVEELGCVWQRQRQDLICRAIVFEKLDEQEAEFGWLNRIVSGGGGRKMDVIDE